MVFVLSLVFVRLCLSDMASVFGAWWCVAPFNRLILWILWMPVVNNKKKKSHTTTSDTFEAGRNTAQTNKASNKLTIRSLSGQNKGANLYCKIITKSSHSFKK